MRKRWGTVLVAGPSMLPTLADGDCLLVRYGGPVRPGAVVCGRLPGLDRLVVKRARAADGPGWDLRSDNPLVSDDSRRYGPGQVEAVVVLRWWPLRRIGRLRRQVPEDPDSPDSPV